MEASRRPALRCSQEALKREREREPRQPGANRSASLVVPRKHVLTRQDVRSGTIYEYYDVLRDGWPECACAGKGDGKG